MKKLQGQNGINFATFLLHGVSLELVSLNISQLWNVQEVFASRRAGWDSSRSGPGQKGECRWMLNWSLFPLISCYNGLSSSTRGDMFHVHHSAVKCWIFVNIYLLQYVNEMDYILKQVGQKSWKFRNKKDIASDCLFSTVVNSCQPVKLYEASLKRRYRNSQNLIPTQVRLYCKLSGTQILPNWWYEKLWKWIFNLRPSQASPSRDRLSNSSSTHLMRSSAHRIT